MNLRAVAKALFERSLPAALRIAPIRPHCVVNSYPDTEGNGIESLRWLAENYRGRIYWLMADPKAEVEYLFADLPNFQARVRRLKKTDPRALLAYWSAEVVFFTHGLYGSLDGGNKRVVVNLSHGDGPKNSYNQTFQATPQSSILICSNERWGPADARAYGLQDHQAVVTGMPRIDQFDRPASDAALNAIGIPADERFVVWAPTYRVAVGDGPAGWQDAHPLTSHADLVSSLQASFEALHHRGLTVVARAHPLDADDLSHTGARVVTNAQLKQAGISNYQLLARSSALVTDYSSIWTDYLALDKPIGYFCPDLDEYKTGRGFIENFESLLAGPLLNTVDALSQFLERVARDEDSYSARRLELATDVGAVVSTGATARCMTAVESAMTMFGRSLHVAR